MVTGEKEMKWLLLLFVFVFFYSWDLGEERRGAVGEDSNGSFLVFEF